MREVREAGEDHLVAWSLLVVLDIGGEVQVLERGVGSPADLVENGGDIMH